MPTGSSGTRVDPSRTEVVPPTAPMEKGPEQEPVLLPKDGDELQVMVDEAVAAFLDQDDVEHDDDGDIPIAASGLTVLVSASDERPMIELRCRLVTGVRGLERALMELDLLNRAHPFAKFHLEDDGVLMVQLVAAAPFVPMQLRVALRTMMTGLDDLARELAARVGGRPNIAAPARMVTRQTLHLDELHEGMVALLELLREHAVSTLAVTTLFSDSRRTITDQIVAVRLGRIDCGDVEPDVVLSHLRRALHRVVGVEVARRRAGKRQPRSQQLSLLPTSEETLDEGDWDTETA